MGRLETLSPSNADAVVDYLARKPHENVYVGWLIASRTLRDTDVAVWRNAAGETRAVCYFGPQIVPCGDDPEALDAFAGYAQRMRAHQTARMIVGPRPSVEHLWSKLRSTMAAPSAIRHSQPVYALDRSALQGARGDAAVARVTLDELDDIVPNSAAMIANEVGGYAKRTSIDFRRRTARIIEAGWWWRHRVDGALAFMCHIGSVTAQTAQIQGVWTPPAMRGRGYATRAFGAICDRMLDEHRSLCLYVNDFNTAATALYEHTGFVRVGEFATIIFN